MIDKKIIEDFIVEIDRECLTQKAKSYSILFSGKIFKTRKGKTSWKEQHHAMAAFRVHLQGRLKRLVLSKLLYSGVVESKWDAYSHPDYNSCWDDFMTYLEETGQFKILELS